MLFVELKTNGTPIHVNPSLVAYVGKQSKGDDGTVRCRIYFAFSTGNAEGMSPSSHLVHGSCEDIAADLGVGLR